MILDQLVEQKDIRAYIRFRSEYLQTRFDRIKKLPKSEKAAEFNRLNGRLRELKDIERKLPQIKIFSKKYARELNQIG